MNTPAYHKVLVALDVFSDYEEVIKKGVNLCADPKQVFLIYVAYPQTSFEPYGLYLERDYTDEVRQRAREIMLNSASQYGIPSDNVFAEYGSAAEEIKAKSEKLNADLIVMGTHGQSGVQLLLGSTANSVLHGVKTDVLAVKLSSK